MGESRSPVGTWSTQHSSVTRRALLRGAAATGAGLLLPSPAQGQPASPTSATPVTGAFRSITKREYLRAVRQHFALTEPPARGGHVVVAMEGDIGSLNPMASYGYNEFIVLGQMFTGLATTSAIDGTWVPDLADWFEVSADGMTYTFHLDPRLTWHDGRPVTAHDCVFTYDAILNEEGLSGTRSEVIAVIDSYRARDDWTLEMSAVAPVAPNVFFEKGLGLVVILPKHVWEHVPFDDWGSVPAATGVDKAQVVGCGPFRFDEWEPGEYVSLVRNEQYWPPEGVPYLDRLSWKIMHDANVAFQAFQAGESDIGNIPESAYEALRESHPSVEFHVHDEVAWSRFVMNGDPGRGGPFVDPRVRQAMLYSLDRDLIVQSLLQGFGVRADGIYPIPSLAHAPERVTTIYNHDPAHARALLDAAGWVEVAKADVREKDGERFEVEILYTEAGPNARQIATYMQETWAGIGINAQPIANDASIMYEQEADGNFDIVLGGFGGFGDDQGHVYRCDAIPPHGFNSQRICLPEFDRLHHASLFELDPVKRRDLLIEQGNVANDEAAQGVLYFKKSIQATQPRLQNYFVNAYTMTGCFPWLWMDEDA